MDSSPFDIIKEQKTIYTRIICTWTQSSRSKFSHRNLRNDVKISKLKYMTKAHSQERDYNRTGKKVYLQLE